MPRRIRQTTIARIKTLVSRARREEIRAFRELPPDNQFQEKINDTRGLRATDPSSLFTADIIKRDLIFTR